MIFFSSIDHFLITVASLSVLFLLRTSEQFTGYTHHSQALIRLVGEQKLVFTLSEWEVLARGLTMQPEQASHTVRMVSFIKIHFDMIPTIVSRVDLAAILADTE